jgi:predicted Zn-dependent protease
MDPNEVKTQLTAIRDNLPLHYSQNSARNLMSSFENYKRVTQTLGNNYSSLLSGVQSEFSDLEFDIKWAMNGTPKKEAESRFSEAKRHIKDDINSILAILVTER